MSIVVMGMDMPTSCRECIERRLGFRAYFGCIKGTVAPSSEERLPDCPLRPLPEKHGRLIDASELETVAKGRLGVINIGHIDEMRTIVEAEGD